MCGILAVLDPGGLSGYAPWIASGIRQAAHRGPDGEGFACFSRRSSGDIYEFSTSPAEPTSERLSNSILAFAHRRLAIIDLSLAGLQPMVSQDGMRWITYNGEIYNYLELRAELEAAGVVFRTNTDTEIILEAYKTWGASCVERFNGMWGFVLLDMAARSLFCSRDRFGIKPFHYYWDGSRFVASSEVKQLLEFPFIGRRANRQAVFEYLRHGSSDHLDETFFAGVYRLQPGSNLVIDIDARSLKRCRYYFPKHILDTAITRSAATEQVRALLEDSVRLQLRSDVPVGSCLSGGLDSSAIVCIANAMFEQAGRASRQMTFSSHFDDPEANEREYMEAVIERTGVQASFVLPTADEFLIDLPALVRAQEEPFGSSSIFAQWSVFKQVGRTPVRVMLDGQGADETLAGYHGLRQTYFAELARTHAYARLLSEICWYGFRLPRRLASSLVERLPGLAAALNRRSPPSSGWMASDFHGRWSKRDEYLTAVSDRPYGEENVLSNLLAAMTHRISIPTLLRYEDRNSMAFSVEARVPFLDHRLVELVMSLPSEFKIHHGQTKAVLREAMRGILPEKIRRRTSKLGFATPEKSWQQTVLRSRIEQSLRDERMREFIDPEKAMVALDQIQGSRVPDFTPWRWLNLSLWFDAYGAT